MHVSLRDNKKLSLGISHSACMLNRAAGGFSQASSAGGGGGSFSRFFGPRLAGPGTFDYFRLSVTSMFDLYDDTENMLAVAPSVGF